MTSGRWALTVCAQNIVAKAKATVLFFISNPFEVPSFFTFYLLPFTLSAALWRSGRRRLAFRP
jgi:hypothetical protein